MRVKGDSVFLVGERGGGRRREERGGGWGNGKAKGRKEMVWGARGREEWVWERGEDKRGREMMGVVGEEG